MTKKINIEILELKDKILAAKEVASHFEDLQRDYPSTLIIVANQTNPKKLKAILKKEIKEHGPSFIYCPNKSFYYHCVRYGKKYGAKRLSLKTV